LLVTRYDEQFGTPASSAGGGLVPQTLAYRYEVWTTQYIPAVTASNAWIYGFGPDLPPQVFWKYTESLYLTLILRGGLPLLAVYAALVLAALVATRRVARRSQDERRTMAQVLFVALALLVPLQTIQAYFVQTGMSHLLWILLALVLRPERPTVPPRRADQQIPSRQQPPTAHQGKG
jgi:O-antigen ligase